MEFTIDLFKWQVDALRKQGLNVEPIEHAMGFPKRRDEHYFEAHPYHVKNPAPLKTKKKA